MAFSFVLPVDSRYNELFSSGGVQLLTAGDMTIGAVVVVVAAISERPGIRGAEREDFS